MLYTYYMPVYTYKLYAIHIYYMRVLEIRHCVFSVLIEFSVVIKEPFCGFQEPSLPCIQTIFPFIIGFKTRPAKFSSQGRTIKKVMGEGWAKYKKRKEKLTKEIREMFTEIPQPRHNVSNGLPHRRKS